MLYISLIMECVCGYYAASESVLQDVSLSGLHLSSAFRNRCSIMCTDDS